MSSLSSTAGWSLKRNAEPEFTTAFDEFMVKVICAAFGVPPAELGFTSDVNRATAGHQENLAYRRGVRPLCLFLQEIFDDVLATDFASPDLAFTFTGGEPEDKKIAA